MTDELTMVLSLFSGSIKLMTSICSVKLPDEIIAIIREFACRRHPLLDAGPPKAALAKQKMLYQFRGAVNCIVRSQADRQIDQLYHTFPAIHSALFDIIYNREQFTKGDYPKAMEALLNTDFPKYQPENGPSYSPTSFRRQRHRHPSIWEVID